MICLHAVINPVLKSYLVRPTPIEVNFMDAARDEIHLEWSLRMSLEMQFILNGQYAGHGVVPYIIYKGRK